MTPFDMKNTDHALLLKSFLTFSSIEVETMGRMEWTETVELLVRYVSGRMIPFISVTFMLTGEKTTSKMFITHPCSL